MKSRAESVSPGVSRDFMLKWSGIVFANLVLIACACDRERVATAGGTSGQVAASHGQVGASNPAAASRAYFRRERPANSEDWSCRRIDSPEGVALLDQWMIAYEKELKEGAEVDGKLQVVYSHYIEYCVLRADGSIDRFHPEPFTTTPGTFKADPNHDVRLLPDEAFKKLYDTFKDFGEDIGVEAWPLN